MKVNSITFVSSINVQSNVKSIYHTQDTPRRSDATLSFGIGVDRASEPEAICVMSNSIEVIRTTHYLKWRPVTKYPNYFVSNTGLVRFKTTFLTPKVGENNRRLFVMMRSKSHFSGEQIHQLVWRHFGSTDILDGYEIHHKDENIYNNHIDNLVYLPKEDHYKLHRKKPRKAA